MSMRWMAYAMAMASLLEGTGPAYPETDPRNTAERSRGLSSGTSKPNRRRSRTAKDSEQALAAAEAKRRRKAEKRLAERDQG